ncbi:hypothetical protein EVAR_28235_1 [Eumeta japonica]|uniref:Uncharacterized protein n=1 Tax=Eumeta variegata TaxID=151549 RepID=A0A4C1V5N6_EUMVA|nr:hypothetical protein EVAR_28235_1 [Eumeta japonica]
MSANDIDSYSYSGSNTHSCRMLEPPRMLKAVIGGSSRYRAFPISNNSTRSAKRYRFAPPLHFTHKTGKNSPRGKTNIADTGMKVFVPEKCAVLRAPASAERGCNRTR